MIKIEKDIPIPKCKSNRMKKSIYPYEEMSVGDSYWCKTNSGVSVAHQYASRHNKELKFISRSENDGFRVWRVK